MSYQTQFNSTLNRLYDRRTYWLKHVLAKPRPGRPPLFNKKKREQRIRKLREIVSKAQAKKLAKKEFKRFKAEKRTWGVSGRGPLAKRKSFNDWVERKIPGKRGQVYVFWSGRRCQYVGRSRGKGTRPRRHFRKKWFRKTTRVDVFLTRRRSAIPLLECLAIHRFLPSENKNKAAIQDWTPKCPLCRLHRDVRTEVRAIFRLR